MSLETFVLFADLLGTFVFALSGATVAVRARLDVFGIIVLSFVAATFGGMFRDLLLGDHPPVALKGWYHIAVSCAAGLFGFYRHRWIEHFRNPVRILDAAGLGLFVALGTQKALEYGVQPIPAMLLGMLTGIGGGVVRDMMAARVPVVFQPTELYAVAALVGAAVIAVGYSLPIPTPVVLTVGAIIVFVMRYMAIRRGWTLPTAKDADI